MNKEKELLLTLFRIPNCRVEVPTIWLLRNSMRDDYYNAHLMIRILAIENYYGINNYGWDLYNKMQRARVAYKSKIPREKAENEQAFKDLIKSFEMYGYLYDHPIVVNKYFRLVDGSHRLSLSVFMGIERIPITITEDSYDEDPEYSLKWFIEMGFDEYIEPIKRKYAEILDKYKI